MSLRNFTDWLTAKEEPKQCPKFATSLEAYNEVMNKSIKDMKKDLDNSEGIYKRFDHTFDDFNDDAAEILLQNDISHEFNSSDVSDLIYPCRVCGVSTEVCFEDLNNIDIDMIYCGRSPSCCP